MEKLTHPVELREKLERLRVPLRNVNEVRAFASFNSPAYARSQCLQWGAMRDDRSWPVPVDAYSNCSVRFLAYCCPPDRLTIRS